MFNLFRPELGRMSAEAGRWKRRTRRLEGPLPEVDPRMEEVLDAWADHCRQEDIYRMEVEGSEARLVTAELISLNDYFSQQYLQIIRHWAIWANDNPPDEPEDGGGITEVGPAAYREVTDQGDPSHPRNKDTTREFLADHPEPRKYEDFHG